MWQEVSFRKQRQKRSMTEKLRKSVRISPPLAAEGNRDLSALGNTSLEKKS
jgi:hypothetical protein